MKTWHWQIYGAVATVLAGVALVLLIQAYGEQASLRREVERLEEQGSSKRVLEPPPLRRMSERGTGAEAALLRTRLAKLEREVKSLRERNNRLERENAQLKEAIARVTTGQTGAANGRSGGSGLSPRGASPTDPHASSATGSQASAPPPVQPPPPAPSGEPWGASREGEIDKLASAVGLDSVQREEVKRIILSAQQEFEKRLIEASQSGERDIMIIERIGEEISKKTEGRIRQILRAEQQERFSRYLEQQAE